MNKELQEAILKEIANYKSNPTKAKLYVTSMKEISIWLQSIVK